MPVLYFKYALLCLFLLSIFTMFIFIGNLYQIENVSSTLEPIFYHQLINNSKPLFPKWLNLRKVYLKEKCKLFSQNSILKPNDFDQAYDHMLVDEKHKLLYCYVPKVACTNWKRIYMILMGLNNSTNILDIPADNAHRKGIIPSLSNYSSSEIEMFLKTFTKFIFVRHPFERLLSAYHNKLEQHYESSKYFQTRFGREIIKKYRINATKKSLDKGDDVTFAEFAAYLISNNNSFNEHWRPIFELCHPCQIDYDIIGKYETLVEDSQFILDNLHINNISFPQSLKASQTSSNLKKYFNTLSPETIKHLYNIYKMDFELFNYSIEGIR